MNALKWIAGTFFGIMYILGGFVIVIALFDWFFL